MPEFDPGRMHSQIVGDATKSPFYEAFAKMPESIPAADQARLQAGARAAIGSPMRSRPRS